MSFIAGWGSLGIPSPSYGEDRGFKSRPRYSPVAARLALP
jgi:hypothetical protein